MLAATKGRVYIIAVTVVAVLFGVASVALIAA